MEKFPDHIDAPHMANGNGVVQSPGDIPYANGNTTSTTTTQPPPDNRFLPVPRRDNSSSRWTPSGGSRHGRQKSLTDAFRTIRTRNGSVSQNAHELADALRAPVSGKLIVSSQFPLLCRDRFNMVECSYHLHRDISKRFANAVPPI